jgi:hypothetical protein
MSEVKTVSRKDWSLEVSGDREFSGRRWASVVIGSGVTGRLTNNQNKNMSRAQRLAATENINGIKL